MSATCGYFFDWEIRGNRFFKRVPDHDGDETLVEAKHEEYMADLMSAWYEEDMAEPDDLTLEHMEMERLRGVTR